MGELPISRRNPVAAVPIRDRNRAGATEERHAVGDRHAQEREREAHAAEDPQRRVATAKRQLEAQHVEQRVHWALASARARDRAVK